LKRLFLQSLEISCRTLDLEQITSWSFIPHYNSITPVKDSSSTLYLNFKSHLYTARKIAQIKLNMNTSFYEGRALDLDMWEEEYCKFCGNQLSLSHALHEFALNVKLRQQLSFLCSDQLSYLRFLLNLGNKKQTSTQYKSTCLFKPPFRIIFKVSYS